MIEFRQVSFTYDQAWSENGLSNIDFTIKDGEVVLLCGESGCGKTTLTRLINGLIPHFYNGQLSGDVLIGGTKINDIPIYETAKIVGSVFQSPRSQFFNVDTDSEIAFGSENQGLPEEEIKKRVKTAVSQFEIEPLMGRSIFELSGGEKQKIACASVSACEPEILVLDEPSANLDAKATAELRCMLMRWKTQGKTIIIAEHRLYYVWDIADRIVYMDQGRIKKIFTRNEFASLGADVRDNMGLRLLSLGKLKMRITQTVQTNAEFELSDFYFSYKNNRSVLDIECLHIPVGASVAVIGHNGAGKSTLIRCLCGLEKKCKGRIFNGGKAYSRKERLKRCYMVMQDVNHQLFTESVLDEVLLSISGENEQQAEEILNGLDLLEMKDLHPMSLSGGQKQRVAIASAVASEREIILFDEPTSGLDLRHMREVASNIWQLNAIGKTIFVVTHDPELILSCCTHVIYMEHGRVLATYPMNEAGTAKMISFFQSATYVTTDMEKVVSL